MRTAPASVGVSNKEGCRTKVLDRENRSLENPTGGNWASNSPGRQDPLAILPLLMRATGLESSIHYTYRREVYASGQEVFMTQRVARPMKFAAFISIIISVAVMLAACQGAVGKQGPKGADGADGTQGGQGPAGTGAFQGVSNPDAVLYNDEELKTGEVALVAEGTSNVITIKAASYFVGGTGPYEYEQVEDFVNNDDAEQTTPASATVTDAKVDKTTGDLTFKIVAPTNGVDDNLFKVGAYTDGFRITVKATDTATDISATSDVIIGLNRAPQLATDDTETLLLGTQAADRDEDGLAAVLGTHEDCTKINECKLAVFIDDDDITVTVASMTVGGVADTTKVSAVEADGRVTLTGMSSTWDPGDLDATPAVDAEFKPVTVNLVATDSKGLETKASVTVNVDAAPSLSDVGTAINGATYNVEGTYTLTTGDGVAFFKNETISGVTLAVAAAPANTGIATVGTNGGIVVTGVTAGLKAGASINTYR